ncbi:helix-turn-helix transcriptional regulator [Olivibacter sp. SDN3]|uniref:winged helix-turn-helix transcriptional regulator n=1 Tax=Olivibacter sp. SDN3 TaxID=2764720 RepID=UPI001651AECA|nr:helix-turn-helix domain-containing protein [Olivibacter sp. SDN3]QNL49350.1 helix-turn-helix transcriptional regulator [Olivibacter sp. SDN3]
MRKLSSTNYYNQVYLEDRCTLNELIYLLSKRWLTDVLFSIEEGHNRFSSIKENLKHISDNILADRLRYLEHYKLIRRNDISNETPPKITYAITTAGIKLSDMLDQLCQFAENEINFPD